MTNLEKIRTMSIVELARFIYELDVYDGIANLAYCEEVCQMRDEKGHSTCEEDNRPCDKLSDMDCIIAWLENEAKG